MISPEVERDMKRGREWGIFGVNALRDLRWPGGCVIPVEGNPHPLCKTLDRDSGIDYIISHEGLNYGISSRAQAKMYRHRNTFTIRRERVGSTYVVPSELLKTVRAIERGAITAAYQFHCYVDVEKDQWPGTPPRALMSWGLAARVPLFRYMADHWQEFENNSASDAERGQDQMFVHPRFDDHRISDCVIDYRLSTGQGPTTQPALPNFF